MQSCMWATYLHWRERDLPHQPPLAHTHSHSRSNTHTTHHTPTGIHTHARTHQTGRHRQDAGPGFVTSFRRGTLCSSSGTKRSAHGSLLEQAHPPSRTCPPPPPLRGQIRSIARLSSSLIARDPSLARPLHMAKWPRRPSLMLQPAASSGLPRYHFPRLFPVGSTQAEWMPRPEFHPNLGNSAPFLQSKRLNIQLTTSDAPFHMRTLLALILHLLYESHLSSTGPRTIRPSSWPRSHLK